MAIFTANLDQPIDIRQINLYWYQNYAYDYDIYKNVNYTVNGKTYTDVAYVDAYDGADNLELGFGGYAFTANSYGDVTGGTVQGMYELDISSQTLVWTLENVSISLKAIYQASYTASNADELSIFASALSGNDKIYLSNGSDYVRGYSGNDIMYGYGGGDTLLGEAGADTLRGGAGADRLNGGTEIDRIYGDGGADFIVGGAGADLLYAGVDTVRDTFDYDLVGDSNASARDTIYNFITGVDKIDLAGIDARSGTATNDAFASFKGTTPTSYSVWYVKADLDSDGAQDDIRLRADVNGNTTADFEVGLLNVASLAAGDIIL